MAQKKRKFTVTKVAKGLEICTPGCASSKKPYSIDCRCSCNGAGHGVLYQAGLSDVDRARVRADVLGVLEGEVALVRARYASAPKLADVRLKAGKKVREWDYGMEERKRLIRV